MRRRDCLPKQLLNRPSSQALPAGGTLSCCRVNDNRSFSILNNGCCYTAITVAQINDDQMRRRPILHTVRIGMVLRLGSHGTLVISMEMAVSSWEFERK